MSITHLLDHTCNVWRRSESLGTYRETVPGYEQVEGGQGLGCTFQRRNTVLGDLGPGQEPVGDRRVYLDVGFNFQDQDVVEIVSGPAGFQGPQLLEVESIAVPRGHHVELRCTEYNGKLPAPPAEGS